MVGERTLDVFRRAAVLLGALRVLGIDAETHMSWCCSPGITRRHWDGEHAFGMVERSLIR